MKQALLVIDVQNAITKSSLTHIQKTVDFINDTLKQFSPDEVFYIRHIEPGSEFDESHKDSELSYRLTVVNDRIIKKFHHSAFFNTALDDTLKNLGVKDLYVCGFQTEYCVDATVKTGHFLGYNVHVYKNGHHTFDREILAEELKNHYNQQFRLYAQMID